MVNPPSMRSDDPPPNISPDVRVFKLNHCISEPDPKVLVDEAWKLLKPALTSILLELDLHRFSFAQIHNVVGKAWWNNKSGEALTNLILDECGTYISKTLQSLAVHCNDDDPFILLALLEKSWLEFPKKLRFICDIAGSGGIKLWDLGLQLFPQKLFFATQLRDKVHTIILLRITDQRLGKYVDMSQLENLMDMFNGPVFHQLRFLEKPFLDSTAEFYAAEAKQVLEHSDLPQYLKHVQQRVGEEKEKCFFMFQSKLLEVVYMELLGVHARAILEKGFEKLMDERPQEDLSRMYHLFSEVDLVGHINDALSSYITKTGEKILKGGSTLTEFKAHVDKICYSFFLEDPLLEKTVQMCFEGLGMPVVSPILEDDDDE